jgi:hypothetical protein
MLAINSQVKLSALLCKKTEEKDKYFFAIEMKPNLLLFPSQEEERKYHAGD